MNKLTFLIVLLQLAFSANIMAYGGGGGGSTKTCKKPRFIEFKPAHLSEVAPVSQFSFLASASTNPKSIKVRVKKLPVEVAIKKVPKGYAVSGNIPATIVDTYARVDIKAKTVGKCPGNDGWLLKIVGAER